MKKFFKYTGVCSLVLGIVAFILVMATVAVVNKTSLGTVTYPGTYAIFGHASTGLLDSTWKASVMGLLSWILALVGLIIVLLGVLLPLFKIKALEKFAGVLNLVAVCCFVLAGVFAFIVVPSFYAANELDVPNTATIGGGWVVAGILYIVAGAIAICPAVTDFLGKKKRK